MFLALPLRCAPHNSGEPKSRPARGNSVRLCSHPTIVRQPRGPAPSSSCVRLRRLTQSRSARASAARRSSSASTPTTRCAGSRANGSIIDRRDLYPLCIQRCGNHGRCAPELSRTQSARQPSRTPLIDRGIRAGDRIGLLFEKSPETYIAMLAVMKVHAAYVPLDAAFPVERVRFIVGDAEISAIVSMSGFADGCPRSRSTKSFSTPTRADRGKRGRARHRSRSRGRAALLHHLHLRHDRPAEGRRRRAQQHLQFRARRLRALRLCARRPRLPGHDHRLRLLGRGDLGAAGGGRDSGPCPARQHPDRRRTRRLPSRTPSHRPRCCPTLLATIEQDLPKLRTLLVGGEACPQNLVQRWYRPGRRILNSYGPTEATVTAT